MSIISASIIPHNPLLVSSISKSNFYLLKKTIDSIKIISEKLKNNNIDTIFIISDNNHLNPNAFTLNLSPEYQCNFEEFGDIETKKIWLGNIGLSHKIREALETKTNLQMTSSNDLTYETSVPLFLLTENLKNIKVIPLFTCHNKTNQEHFEFGKILKKELLKREERIAIICSGDLSHKINKDSPAGYTPKGKKFDQRIINYLKENNAQEILDIKDEIIKEVKESAIKSMAVFLGILNEIKHEPKMLSYEHPFGVGHLVMDFII